MSTKSSVKSKKNPLSASTDPSAAHPLTALFTQGISFLKRQDRDWKVTVLRTSLDKLAYQMVFPYLSIYIVALGATGTQLGPRQQHRHDHRRALRPFHGLADRPDRPQEDLPDRHRHHGRLLSDLWPGAELGGDDRGHDGLLDRVSRRAPTAAPPSAATAWSTGTGPRG